MVLGRAGSDLTGTHRSADEHAVEWAVRLAEPFDLKRGLEGFDLGTEPIAFNGHRYAAEELLATLFRALDPPSEQDRSGASAPHWFRFKKLTHGLEKACEPREERDRCGFCVGHR